VTLRKPFRARCHDHTYPCDDGCGSASALSALAAACGLPKLFTDELSESPLHYEVITAVIHSAGPEALAVHDAPVPSGPTACPVLA
jgi:hypothetical protein